MFEELDAVDWKQLQARQIPTYLRQFLSEDRLVRRRAAGHIEEILKSHIIMDDFGGDGEKLYKSDYEVACQLVPFLIELLANPTTADKGTILGLLIIIANYREYSKQCRDGESWRMEVSSRMIQQIRSGRDVYREIASDPSMSADCQFLLGIID